MAFVNLDEKYNTPKCQLCGKIYRDSKSLAAHLRYGCNREPHLCCPRCNYRAKTNSNLKRHVLLQHSNINLKLAVNK
uniref:C2H2-type domain-containing protein n=1 Tax=Rhodnius prolixus TaxID=13249 RepID=T1HQ07_RHOPR